MERDADRSRRRHPHVVVVRPDAAGNIGTATQSLTVDHAAVTPAVGRSDFTPVGPKRVFDTPARHPNAVATLSSSQGRRRHRLEVKITDLPGSSRRRSGSGVAERHRHRPEGAGFVTVYACGSREFGLDRELPRRPDRGQCGHRPGVDRARCASSASLRPTSSSTSTVGSPPARLLGDRPEARVRHAPRRRARSVARPCRRRRSAAAPCSGEGHRSRRRSGDRSRRCILERHGRPPSRAGFITVYPCGNAELVSSVNYSAGQTVSNAVIAPVSADGNVCFYSSSPPIWSSTSTAGSRPARVHRCHTERVFDTRAATAHGVHGLSPRPRSAATTSSKYKSLTSPVWCLPRGVGAVSLNVAVTNPDGPASSPSTPAATRKRSPV